MFKTFANIFFRVGEMQNHKIKTFKKFTAVLATTREKFINNEQQNKGKV